MSKGSIYILQNPAFRENMLKIGRTEGNIQKRAKQLFTTGVPDEFIVCYEEDVPDCVLAERVIHQKLNNYSYKKKQRIFCNSSNGSYTKSSRSNSKRALSTSSKKVSFAFFKRKYDNAMVLS